MLLSITNSIHYYDFCEIIENKITHQENYYRNKDDRIQIISKFILGSQRIVVTFNEWNVIDKFMKYFANECYCVYVFFSKRKYISPIEKKLMHNTFLQRYGFLIVFFFYDQSRKVNIYIEKNYYLSTSAQKKTSIDFSFR